jgi:hypothetical protein
MTAKQRIQRLEKTAPKPTETEANLYAAMTDKELLQATKRIVENTEPVTQEDRALLEKAKAILQNNGIAFTDKAVTA